MLTCAESVTHLSPDAAVAAPPSARRNPHPAEPGGIGADPPTATRSGGNPVLSPSICKLRYRDLPSDAADFFQKLHLTRIGAVEHPARPNTAPALIA